MKHAIRQLAKNPGFTVVALATLALGIGVNTTAFTVLNRLLLQSLPFRDTGRLVQIWGVSARNPFMEQGPGDYLFESDQNTVFEGMAAYVPGARGSLAEPGQPPAQYGDCPVTASFFPVMGIVPQLGRVFTAEEESRFEQVAVVGNKFWREHYGADPKIVGRTIKLNTKIVTIVGVMPPALDDPMLFNQEPAFWMLDPTRLNVNLHGGGWYHVVARLKPGVTMQQAQAEMDVIAARLAREYPNSNKDYGLKVVPYPANSMGDTGAQLTWLVLALSGLVLLIACVNLANLQLVRTTRRAQEFGIRIALGCPRSALIGMLLTESIVLSVAGGALGLLVARWSNAYVARFFEFPMPLDWRVIGFTFLVALVTGAVFGTLPAWIASRTDVNAALKSGGRAGTSDRSRHWLRQGLVVLELSMALTLLAGAGFFVTGIYKLSHRDLHWRTDNLLIGYIELDHDNYGEQNDPRSLVFSERMITALQALPGVEAAESGDTPTYGFRPEAFRIDGQPVPEKGREMFAGAGRAGPGFFQVYGVQLLRGRDFLETDRIGSPKVVIINEAMAEKFWPGENPVGKRIGGEDPADPAWAEIVGVMSDFKGGAEFYNPAAGPYKFLRPWAQNTHRFIGINVRTRVAPEAVKESVRKAIGLLAPDIALSNLGTVQETLSDLVAYFTFLRRILIQISVLGLLLAAVGIYGVVANLASERTKEIGIRLALGAEARGIIWLFLRNGVQLALVGAAIGLGAAFVLLNILTKMLPMVPGSNPWVVVGVAVLLVAVAVFASWLPARRTTKVSPVIALRAE